MCFQTLHTTNSYAGALQQTGQHFDIAAEDDSIVVFSINLPFVFMATKRGDRAVVTHVNPAGKRICNEL